jgi:ArsR family transcriptional regulator
MCEEPHAAHPTPLATTACCGIGVDGGLSREAGRDERGPAQGGGRPVRLRLLSAIRATDAGEACVCDLTPLVGLSQPTVSHHLKVLVEAGLLEREKRGTGRGSGWSRAASTTSPRIFR